MPLRAERGGYNCVRITFCGISSGEEVDDGTTELPYQRTGSIPLIEMSGFAGPRFTLVCSSASQSSDMARPLPPLSGIRSRNPDESIKMVTAAQRAKAGPVKKVDSPVTDGEGDGYSRGHGLVPLSRPPMFYNGWETDGELLPALLALIGFRHHGRSYSRGAIDMEAFAHILHCCWDEAVPTATKLAVLELPLV